MDKDAVLYVSLGTHTEPRMRRVNEGQLTHKWLLLTICVLLAEDLQESKYGKLGNKQVWFHEGPRAPYPPIVATEASPCVGTC